MKKLHSTCEEYCNYNKTTDLHDISGILLKINNINEFPNTIIYGNNGIGKYTQALKLIKNISPTNLKYERKISFEFQKEIYNFLISDVHIEVDMDMLGCHSKLLWHEIFSKYVDVVLIFTLLTTSSKL